MCVCMCGAVVDRMHAEDMRRQQQLEGSTARASLPQPPSTPAAPAPATSAVGMAGRREDTERYGAPPMHNGWMGGEPGTPHRFRLWQGDGRDGSRRRLVGQRMIAMVAVGSVHVCVVYMYVLTNGVHGCAEVYYSEERRRQMELDRADKEQILARLRYLEEEAKLRQAELAQLQRYRTMGQYPPPPAAGAGHQPSSSSSLYYHSAGAADPLAATVPPLRARPMLPPETLETEDLFAKKLRFMDKALQSPTRLDYESEEDDGVRRLLRAAICWFG